MSYLPESVLLWTYPQGQMFNVFKEVCHLILSHCGSRRQPLILDQRAKQHIHKAMTKSLDASQNQNSLFQHILNSDMPESERSEERLAREAQTLLGGGTASTARTIGFASFWILSRPDIRTKLEAELRDTMRDWPQRVPSWAELEKLPYLQAIIKESLRYVACRISISGSTKRL